VIIARIDEKTDGKTELKIGLKDRSTGMNVDSVKRQMW
jgi:hypothetical protein